MLCPICNVDLLLSEKQGIEIDYCPKCRGIWLDRGEMDKIIERSQAFESNGGEMSYDKNRKHYDHDDDDDNHHGFGDKYSSKYGQRKKRGFLGDLLDF